MGFFNTLSGSHNPRIDDGQPCCLEWIGITRRDREIPHAGRCRDLNINDTCRSACRFRPGGNPGRFFRCRSVEQKDAISKQLANAEMIQFP